MTYRVRNASIVDSGINEGSFVESTIFAGEDFQATLAQEASNVGSTPLPTVLTFLPVCSPDSVGGTKNPGDECDPMLAECGSGTCGCESALPGVTCTQSGDPNNVSINIGQDLVFTGNEQKNVATIRVKVSDLVGAPAVCGLFYTRIDSSGDVLVTTDELCDSGVTAGAQASADLHTSECITNADCGDEQCNECVQNESGNVCAPANLGGGCGSDENTTDCLLPACVDEGGVGVCEQEQTSAADDEPCDNNDGVPVEPSECREPICVSGTCELGDPLDCSDGVGCTIDRCNEAGDACENVPDDSLCANDDFCDGDETCDVLNDCQPGTPPDCGDGVDCTTDTCNEDTDSCDHTPEDSACSNGEFCDGDEICDLVEDCQPGTPPDCSDAFECTADSCNETTDMCDNVPNNQLCANGEFCDGTEICDPASGCVPGIPVPCDDAFICSADSCNEDTDMCEHDFTPCVCGDGEITGAEVCDPPEPAGTWEDCNNSIDDDADGLVDCRDPNCKPNARGPLCDENCQLDLPCTTFIRDPARIVFNRKEGPDEVYLHGRIPLQGDFSKVGQGMTFELSNDDGAIYRASLAPGDLKGSTGGRWFRFRDRDAKQLGEASARGGLAWVRFRTRNFRREPFLVFTVRAYADLSAANRFNMTSKLTAGPQVGFLTAEWTATWRGWKLHQVDFE